jgi:transcriptional regulator with XRE-family HTH domain
MNTGKAFKFLREDQRMTQRQAAKRSGLSAAYIGRIENNKNEPSKKAREKLMRALGVHPIQVWLRSIEPEDIPEDKRHLYFKLFPAIEGLVSLMVDDTRQGGLPKLDKPIITQKQADDVLVEIGGSEDVYNGVDDGIVPHFELKTRDGHPLKNGDGVWIVDELTLNVVTTVFGEDSNILPMDCFKTYEAAKDYMQVMYPEK